MEWVTPLKCQHARFLCTLLSSHFEAYPGLKCMDKPLAEFICVPPIANFYQCENPSFPVYYSLTNS